MNKPVYLGLSILELSKIIIYQSWYDYEKPKYGEKAKLYYMGTNSFIVYIKTDDIHKDITEDVETRFDTSNYELVIDRPLLKGKNKKSNWINERSISEIMTKFVGLRAKTYSYLIDEGGEKDCFKLMNNAVFGKIMENVRKHRDIKLVITERGRNYLVSEPNYHTTKFFTENLLAIEMNLLD